MTIALGTRELDAIQERASLEVEMLKSSQKWRVQRSAVGCIAWLDGFVEKPIFIGADFGL